MDFIYYMLRRATQNNLAGNFWPASLEFNTYALGSPKTPIQYKTEIELN